MALADLHNAGRRPTAARRWGASVFCCSGSRLSRPKDPASQAPAALGGGRGDPVFQESHRSYALIGLSYRSLKGMGINAQAEPA